MRYLLSFLLLLVYAHTAYCQSVITFRRSFVDSICNRLTMTASYNVWFAHPRPNAPQNDGDIHVSGYDAKIGMPVVAEVMNAVTQQSAMKLLQSHAGKGRTDNPRIAVTGVWRMWPEHLGAKGNPFYQGMTLTDSVIKKKSTNPDHVFELHPLTKVADIDVTGSLHDIDGYAPWYAWHVLEQVAKKKITITSSSKTISIALKQMPFNYVDAWVRLDSIWKVKDGAFALCTVLDYDYKPGDPVHEKVIGEDIRVGFVKGSEAYLEAISKGNTGIMHVLGTTRVNLAVVAAYTHGHSPDPIEITLPLEIVAVGLSH